MYLLTKALGGRMESQANPILLASKIKFKEKELKVRMLPRFVEALLHFFYWLLHSLGLQNL